MKTRIPAVLLGLAALSGAAAAMQEAGAEPEEIERLEAWPEPEDEAALRLEIERLRKARTEEMGAEGKAALIAMGAAVVPELLPKLPKERDEEARLRILAVLEAVTDARHTRLLAREFEDGSADVRTFCLQRVARFPDPGVAKPAEAALEQARKTLAKARKKEDRKEAEAEVYAAALCTSSAGSLGGLGDLAARAAADWGRHGEDIRRAIEPLRGPAAADRVAEGLASDERDERLAALHLLAGCGDAESKGLVAPFLDSTDRGIQLAAINALRGMVDRDPPLERLPVFEMIELAGKWKARL